MNNQNPSKAYVTRFFIPSDEIGQWTLITFKEDKTYDVLNVPTLTMLLSKINVYKDLQSGVKTEFSCN